MQVPKGFGSDEVTGQFLNFLNSQLALLEELYQYQFTNLKHLDDSRIGNLYTLLFSIWHTGKSISLLAMHQHINECFILARSFLERLITYIYLLFCDEEEHSQYLAYTKQKAYRVLDRSFSAGNLRVKLKWSGSIDLEKEPKLKEAADMFTSNKGKIKTRWPSKNISKMLDLISNKGGLDIGYLMLATLWIYDDASEALHGTLYGSTFHMGIFTGERAFSKDELKKIWNERFSALFLALGTSSHTLIQGFNKLSAIENIARDSKDNLRTISSTMKQMK
ncbi:MAG TPA: hypothetical protein G4O20_08345 [Dehalococcoidia bacterium]|nr:hypothetical protein [Dehalococcoidia bacterium]